MRCGAGERHQHGQIQRFYSDTSTGKEQGAGLGSGPLPPGVPQVLLSAVLYCAVTVVKCLCPYCCTSHKPGSGVMEPCRYSAVQYNNTNTVPIIRIMGFIYHFFTSPQYIHITCGFPSLPNKPNPITPSTRQIARALFLDQQMEPTEPRSLIVL